MFSHLVWMQIQQIYTTKHEGKWIWKLKMRSCVVLLTEHNLESVILVFSITDLESCLPPSVPFFRRQVDCTFAWWWPWTGLWVVTSAPMTTIPSLRHPFVGYQCCITVLCPVVICLFKPTHWCTGQFLASTQANTKQNRSFFGGGVATPHF